MIWDESRDFAQEWGRMYEIAKMYYNQYGNLNISRSCKVLIENNNVVIVKKEDPRYKNAIRLGEWLNNQRQAKKGQGKSRWNKWIHNIWFYGSKK